MVGYRNLESDAWFRGRMDGETGWLLLLQLGDEVKVGLLLVDNGATVFVWMIKGDVPKGVISFNGTST